MLRNRKAYKAYKKAYYLANCERLKERAKKWRLRNLEHSKQVKKKYYLNNRERLLEQSKILRRLKPEQYKAAKRRYYLKNKQYLNERSKQWAQRNREKRLEISRRYHLKHPRAKPPVTAYCLHCGNPFLKGWRKQLQLTCSELCRSIRHKTLQAARRQTETFKLLRRTRRNPPIFADCVICGESFRKNTKRITCSQECRRQYKKFWCKSYRRSRDSEHLRLLKSQYDEFYRNHRRVAVQTVRHLGFKLKWQQARLAKRIIQELRSQT